MAGGPNGGIYKSIDAGASWQRKEAGLPAGDVGKIGLAVTAADPDLVYATIEADEENKGFYRSADQGESWSKKNPVYFRWYGAPLLPGADSFTADGGPCLPDGRVHAGHPRRG